MLTRQEKDDLMTIINILFDDNQLRGLKHNFNERTAEVVEQAMEELVKCNASMKELVTGLTMGISVFTRGWLKQSLDRIARALRDKQLQFDGMGCRNQVTINFRMEIYRSAL
jgi:urease gamma subunit|tara:strand:- start:146 stop:481 length:336 start_codon:yes stop_codon:yes gene_type:complete